MVAIISGLLPWTILWPSAVATADWLSGGPQHQQHPVLATLLSANGESRKLQGRFLHITDIHPDPFYKVGTDPDGEHPCHSGKGETSAGYFGAEMTSCDTPFTLVNATFDWIERNLRDSIDFVVWTGDSARHDNDEKIPRTHAGVEGLNRYIVDKFVEVFGRKEAKEKTHDHTGMGGFVVPIVPTFGNNDILPHNIFEPGPNRWTKKYLDIWSKFVPEEQKHSFARGGWFFTEVIPNRLAVISLNTLFFFDSNSAVDGCDLKSEPGYEHMEWLRVQLQFLRERGMKAILIGHVPPARTDSKQSWDETCYQKYTLWLRQFRDVIVGSLYGHMNIDHFMFQDMHDLVYKFGIPGIEDTSSRSPSKSASYTRSRANHDEFHITAKTTYLNELRDTWAELPAPPQGGAVSSSHLAVDDHVSSARKSKNKNKKKKHEKYLKEIGGPYAERFSMSFVSPSVVPNYFPTLRVIEYNISGLEHEHPASTQMGVAVKQSDLLLQPDWLDSLDTETTVAAEDDEVAVDDGIVGDQVTGETKNKKKKKKKKKKKPHFQIPSPPSSTSLPGPAYLSQPLSFLSWTQMYANLTRIHAEMGNSKHADWTTESARKHFKYEVEYTTNNDKHGYGLRDLTVRSWVDLAERIGRESYDKSNENRSVIVYDEEDDEEPSTDDDKTDEDTTSSGPEMASTENQHVMMMTTTTTTKKKKSLKANRLWHAFVSRAFILTRDESDLEDDFG